MVEAAHINPADILDAETPNIYTMPSGMNFLQALAKTLHTALGDTLSDAMIFLPTRRAVRGLSEAFLDLSGGAAVLLPTLRTLADIDENEPPFAPGELALDILPEISDTERRFALSKLVAAKMSAEGDAPAGPAAALAMADPLLSVMNDLATEELPLSAVKALSDRLDLLPEHHQNAVAFIDILSRTWPAFLGGRNLIDPMERRIKLLNAASEKWRQTPPRHPVIVAGSTGTLQATARFINTVSSLPKGLVVLPGLDLNLDEDIWEALDDQHPQYALRRLLAVLNTSREHVAIWPGANPKRSQRNRERVLAESLIPVETTADWPSRIAKVEKDISNEGGVQAALEGLSLISAQTSEEEAALIALIMREALEAAGKNCVLITPDPALARRVRAKLSRFGIEADSSAGEPLEETAHGAFLTHILALTADPFDPVALRDLYTHALFSKPGVALADWQRFEAQALRGPRAQDYAAIQARLKRSENPDAVLMVKAVHDACAPLNDLGGGAHDPAVWASAHVQIAEHFAGGPQALWSGEAGEKAAAVLEELIQYGHYLAPVDLSGYIKLLSVLMRGRVVRPRYGTQTRLQILGPLEARMVSADMVILGGLNEGVWPAHPAPHPLLSRGMRKAIGLTTQERRFGQSAHDFAQLANHPNVIMTRSERGDDGPQVMSRWLWRLTTLVKGALKSGADEALAPGAPYLQWARIIDEVPQSPVLSKQPEPRPQLDMRWPNGRRKLTVTQIQTWIRDPYSIYAKKILGLVPLGLPDLPQGPSDYGTAIHKALELGLKSDIQTKDHLKTLLVIELEQAGYAPHSFARMMPTIDATAEWTSDWIKTRRTEGWVLSGAERRGKMTIQPGGDHDGFTLSGTADLIEKHAGKAAVFDFKTGNPSNAKTIKAGFDPQLPLLAAMCADGAFGPKLPVVNLGYITPTKQKPALAFSGDEIAGLVDAALSDLKSLIKAFDQLQTAYTSQPRAQYTNRYGEFDHLARRAEWAALADKSGGGYD